MANATANNKRIAKNTLFLYVRMFVTLGVSLFTVRIVLQTKVSQVKIHKRDLT